MFRYATFPSMLAMVVCASAIGCGATDDVAVRVDGAPISKATVEHWTTIQAIVSGNVPAGQPVPRGLVPDPPSYTVCIGYLEKEAALTGTAARSVVTLKRECGERAEAARSHVLAILITYRWLQAEGARRHVRVSGREVVQQMAEFRRSFPSEAAFRDYLRRQGKKAADEAFILRLDLLLSKLKRAIAASSGATAAEEFLSRLPRMWTAKTDCAAGYLVPGCKQYKGSATPEITT